MSRVEFMQGNTACAEGALAAGCRFFAGYPITPSTEVAEHMALKLPKQKGVFVQMEDEIASIAAVIGAAWTGARAMTATSGPGFSLMMENIGYAAMTETPCVVVNIQRGGPSTGQPTLGAQGDMLQCRFGSHGDYSIIALSPASVQEMFELTVKAFDLSERYRVPTFLMGDEIIGHMRERLTIPDSVEVASRRKLDKGALPFKAGDDGIPGFPTFGEGYGVHVTGLTHDERGYPAMNVPTHDKMQKRLWDKIVTNADKIVRYEQKDLAGAEVVVVSYGITSRIA
ncbi:MAG TPA: 2-oxoacid:acceptor oxidoreductase subunit alpha, partial [Methanomicrobiales archaeon]|nr:2-oxoacid:acceptor oxidoreductase subunit alpha [Methanomicrobiales archaeon]